MPKADVAAAVDLHFPTTLGPVGKGFQVSFPDPLKRIFNVGNSKILSKDLARMNWCAYLRLPTWLDTTWPLSRREQAWASKA